MSDRALNEVPDRSARSAPETLHRGQRVDQVRDAEAADAFGLHEGQVTVLVHSGSRGLGHQVCTDYVKRMDAALTRHGIVLPDRQLSCAPLSSDEGRAYLGAMAAAANFAWSNRAAIADSIRRSVGKVLGSDAAENTRQVYDVAHNVAKLESYGGASCACIARARPVPSRPGRREILPITPSSGSRCFIPGSMGTCSFVLAGRREPWSARSHRLPRCGRRLSRTRARKEITGAELRRQLEADGIAVASPSNRGLAEEAPFAYKDVERVVAIVERAGLAATVAKLVPIGVVKG